MSIILLNEHKPKLSLQQKAIEIRQLKLALTKAEKDFKEMKELILNEMGDLTVILDNNGYELITLTSYVTHVFNSKKFELDFPDILKHYKEPQTRWNFNIK